jgi:hypothetical protein
MISCALLCRKDVLQEKRGKGLSWPEVVRSRGAAWASERRGQGLLIVGKRPCKLLHETYITV